MKYCSVCGASLILKKFENRERSYCPSCQRFQFKQLKVGAGAIIEQGGKLLLFQRANPPFLGDWNLPAGYVEHDEHPSQAVIREVVEETGLRVRVDGLVDVYLFTDDPRGNGILIVYACKVVGGELTASAEGESLKFFSPDELPSNLAGGGHDQAIRAWETGENP